MIYDTINEKSIYANRIQIKNPYLNDNHNLLSPHIMRTKPVSKQTAIKRKINSFYLETGFYSPFCSVV